MKTDSRFVLLLIVLASAAGSFVATYAWQPDQTAPPPARAPSKDAVLADWLDLDPAQAEAVTALEVVYRADRRELEHTLRSTRETLADLFEDPAVSDDEILAQVELVIEASSALERRTASFLLAVRPHLNSEQQRHLLGHCAAGVRSGGGYRWRHGQRDDGELRPGRGGPPPGRGPGHGRGRGGPPH